MSFDPMPKRVGVNPDGITLEVRKMPMDVESMPYNKAIRSQDRKMLEYANQELLEQPDVSMEDYELDTLDS